MGMNLWFTPHNSEHWPYKIEFSREGIEKERVFIRPGIASIFIMMGGSAHLCMTSPDETTFWMGVKVGRRIFLQELRYGGESISISLPIYESKKLEEVS